MVERLLKVRSNVKKRKPTFRRQQSNQFAKFKNDDSWRKPKGHQSKIRLKRKGHQKMPTVGFKSPKAVRGLNRAGLEEVVVNNVSDLTKVDAKTQIAVIGRTVGAKKRLEVLAEGKKLKLNFANVSDIDAKIKELTKAPKKAEKKASKKEAKVEDKKEKKSTDDKKAGGKKE